MLFVALFWVEFYFEKDLKMKTLDGWNESGVNFDKYVTEPCIVDEALKDDIMYYVGTISDFENKLYQVDEAEGQNEDGELTYTTFAERDDVFYYLGVFISVEDNDMSHLCNMIDNIKK